MSTSNDYDIYVGHPNVFEHDSGLDPLEGGVFIDRNSGTQELRRAGWVNSPAGAQGMTFTKRSWWQVMCAHANSSCSTQLFTCQSGEQAQDCQQP